jgi:hypothetical protein
MTEENTFNEEEFGIDLIKSINLVIIKHEPDVFTVVKALCTIMCETMATGHIERNIDKHKDEKSITNFYENLSKGLIVNTLKRISALRKK